jgi:hypothetical protein
MVHQISWTLDPQLFFFCVSQGKFEPFVCPAGNYCPVDAVRPIKCPGGSFCPTGSTSPVKCDILGFCPAGSKIMRYYGGVLIAVLLDLVLGAMYLFYKYKTKRRLRFNALPQGQSLQMDDMEANDLRKPTSLDDDSSSFEIPATSNSTLVSGFRQLMNNQKVQVNFEFRDLQVKLKTGKTILENVSGEINSGCVTAIMGPSGAGKVPIHVPASTCSY